MSQVIRISDILYKRLESHALGFDTPSRVIEVILDAYEGKESDFSPTSDISEVEPSTYLEKVFSPKSQEIFKEKLLINKRAFIKLHYTNGKTDTYEWNASNLSSKSSITGNLHSGYLRDWKNKGIVKAEIVIDKGILSEMNRTNELDEVNKVARRLKLWAERPEQINSKILNSYLKIEQSGLSPIKESDIAIQMAKEPSFKSNFAQMKNISEKNHGKIFDQDGENIFLWKPILPLVRKYEKKVFDSCS